MTTEEPSDRFRRVVPPVAAIWSVIFFRFIAHASWGAALVLAGLAAVFYFMEPDTWRRRALLTFVVAGFGGLGALWVAGLGPLSILAALVGAAGFLLYCWLEDRGR